MKEWRVYSKQEPGKGHRGVIIWWPEWDEREARTWLKENANTEPGNFYEGITLELVEFETDHEKAIRERDAALAEARERIKELNNTISASVDREDRKQERIAALEGVLEALADEVDGLVGESSGVYGFHLKPAPWHEILGSGRFERLGSLSAARALLTETKTTQNEEMK